MDHITTDKLKELARINDPHCISIFIPTYRTGQEVNERVDQKNLKNQIKVIRNKLESFALKGRDIEKILKPVNDLLNDSGFWKLQSDGLAIFRNHNFFEYYTLPVVFEPYNYIADHFYPMPLIPFINDKVKFYLLAISMGEVRFYEGFPHQIKEMEMEDLLPEKLEEVVGYDFEEKHLQYRTGNDERGRATYHGHGITNEEQKKLEILKFFKAVNEGLMKVLNNQKTPLILATVDYLMPLYKEVNDYKHLHEEFIAGNPEHVSPQSLHEKARNMIQKDFNTTRKARANKFEHALSNQKASYKEEEILPAAVDGRIDTLFIKKGAEEIWGIYDNESKKMLKREREEGPGAGLLNMAAMHTILNSGMVYLTDNGEMPEPGSKMNAIYRF
jgi:hypothetical protein